MEFIEITREMLEQARDYVPLAEKEAWIDERADRCFNRLSVVAGDDPLPPMYMVNTGLKSRYLMGALAKLYFNAEFNAEVQDDGLMTVEEYDKWAGSHVINQIERWKSDRELRNKCFDLISDYNDFTKFFNANISAMLMVQNDSVVRQSQYTTAQMAELPVLLSELQKLQEGKENGEQSG